MSMMDDTIEQIVKAAKEAVKCYGGDDQYMILEEVSPYGGIFRSGGGER